MIHTTTLGKVTQVQAAWVQDDYAYDASGNVTEHILSYFNGVT